MRKSAYNIAVCAIFGALQLIFIVCAKYVEILTLSFYVLASCALIMPLTKKMYKESILTFVAVSILSSILGLIPECFVYILISGAYTLISVIAWDKKVKPIFSYPIKIIWTNLSFLVFYFFFREFITIDLSQWGIEIISFWIYPIVVTIITVVYDFLLRYLYLSLTKFSDRIFKN